jgi:hypothetical protein
MTRKALQRARAKAAAVCWVDSCPRTHRHTLYVRKCQLLWIFDVHFDASNCDQGSSYGNPLPCKYLWERSLP